MANWQMRYTPLGGSVSSYWNINAPNNDINITMNSTRTVHNLYTGDKARTIPTTKYTYNDITIEWSFISASNVLLTSAGATLSLNTIVAQLLSFSREF